MQQERKVEINKKSRPTTKVWYILQNPIYKQEFNLVFFCLKPASEFVTIYLWKYFFYLIHPVLAG